MNGDETEENVLEIAGIKNAAGLFAVSTDDNVNLVITFLAWQMIPDLRIVSKSNYAKNFDKIKKTGANSVVSPNVIGGLRIASEMIRSAVVTLLDTMIRDRDKALRVEEIPVKNSSAGKVLKDLGLKNNRNALLIAINEKINGSLILMRI
ncbi:MAG TPA: NAD-binding protein [Ignavibacteriaceae bacterium]|nr:NAD-binding protein [Ignavibacteriaceae bacterium]